MEHKANKKRLTAKKIIINIILTVIILAIAALAAAYFLYRESLKAACVDSCVSKDFVVADASSGATIAESLESEGLIKSALAFKIFLKVEAENKTLMPGRYKFDGSLSVKDIIEKLNEGTIAETFRITFLPGGTLVSARERLQNVGYSDEAITKAFAKKYDHPLLASKPDDASLEGYIYGETYEFYLGESVENVLTKVFDEMYKVVQENQLETKFKAAGLSLHQGIILASVVQSEAGIMPLADQKQVAQVFSLRLKRGMALGSDAVIAYRADQINPDRNKSDMSYLTSIGCPWNSRNCTGLPPAPISNPGKNALISAAEPADGDYIYFISGYDGDGKLSMFYARTAAEHQQNIKNYCGDLCSKL